MKTPLILIVILFCGRTAALALTATGCFPANKAAGVCVDAPLKITFDAPPTLGTAGTVKIFRGDGTLADTVDLALNDANGTQPRAIGGVTCNARVALVAGNVATVFPHAGVLAYNATYYVTVDAGVFPGFAGVGGANAWRFTTKAQGPAAGGDRLVVAADGSGDFCTVQGALDFLPAKNTAHVTVLIRNGTYRELVRVESKHNISFRGQDRRLTVIEYPNNNNINPGAATRTMCNVAADDISFGNLTLSNSTPKGGSQAEALRVNGRRCVVDRCDLHSYQDTFLINSASDTAYFKDSLVEGSVDFIWGAGRVVFEKCEIKSLGGGYVCQMRNPAGQCGAVFLDCRFTRTPDEAKVYLARIDPGVFPDSAVALVNCALDTHIRADGWLLNKTGVEAAGGLRFWEYQSTDLAGRALPVDKRAGCSSRISESQAAALRNLSDDLGGWSPDRPGK